MLSRTPSAPSLSRIQGRIACTNCRRRKIKCNSARPTCNQCRLRPPRKWAPCSYPAHGNGSEQTPDQMLVNIRLLKDRVDELESLLPPDSASVYLTPPYPSPSSSRISGSADLDSSGLQTSQPICLMEPPSDLMATLVDTFLARFAGSWQFFLDPILFRQSVLRPLPFGDPNRPAPALLCAVYLWGSVFANMPPANPYTPEALLVCCLQNIPQDLDEIIYRPNLVVETIQAQILLSLYYMHTALPVQGRYHSSAAVSIALVRGPVPQGVDTAAEADLTHAFWAVVILNNIWVAVDGAPSSIQWDLTQIAFPSGSGLPRGTTILSFLNGDDLESSPIALLVKASIMLERVITLSSHIPDTLARLGARLDRFQGLLPSLSGDIRLILAHALTDSAILRLHAPHVGNSDIAARKCRAAAARLVANIREGRSILAAEPMLGPIYSTLCSFYSHRMAILWNRSIAGDFTAIMEHQELNTSFDELMWMMSSAAPFSPILAHCLAQAQHEWDKHPRMLPG
ncbi:hypothetical protein DFH09DRAFT_1153828 [Mycena vulgaris]|nr:hypothetical protein DFH09DRAFT_1153828 [Mycena vulgaris]